MTFQTVMKD